VAEFVGISVDKAKEMALRAWVEPKYQEILRLKKDWGNTGI
jgi:hypothetical protein